ncbi:MAG: hypothetical protein HWN65_23085 [Candidatus Helarchaeota archaeon]|nr:hypothetical protein [Candidatus Helarchaeota archaeon]
MFWIFVERQNWSSSKNLTLPPGVSTFPSLAEARPCGMIVASLTVPCAPAWRSAAGRETRAIPPHHRRRYLRLLLGSSGRWASGSRGS